MSIKSTTPAQHKSNLRNVYGTFAIEGMTISKATRSNLDRIGSGRPAGRRLWRNCVQSTITLIMHN